jgi:hypothetical protein
MVERCAMALAERRRSRASRQADAHRRGKGLPRAVGVREASQDLFPASRAREPERDPAVKIDPLEPRGRVALRPSRIGQVLLWRVRDGARPEEERDSTHCGVVESHDGYLLPGVAMSAFGTAEPPRSDNVSAGSRTTSCVDGPPSKFSASAHPSPLFADGSARKRAKAVVSA